MTEVTELVEKIMSAWSKETSYDPAGWTSENPAWGHCAVSALIVQDVFGGEILTGKVNGFHHYWNKLPNETETDLTLSQFGRITDRTESRISSREYILSFPDTVRRYNLLRQRVGL